MNRFIAFLVRYPIWANVLMLSVFSFGFIALNQLNYSAFPETRPPYISVRVVYPGASPQEVEEGVVLRIEEALDGIEGVERITSTSEENIGSVLIEVQEDTDRSRVLTDVKNAIDRINSFPTGSERPVVFELRNLSNAAEVVVYGNTSLYNLKYIAEGLRDELLGSAEISQIQFQGLPQLEISIEVSESELRRYRISFQEIVEAVRNANVNISGGKVETAAEELLIRAHGMNYHAKEFENLILRGAKTGSVVYLKDVANVLERWEDVPDKSYYNDRPAILLDIDKTKEESVLDVVRTTEAALADFNARNDQVHAVLINDRSIEISQRLELLYKNGAVGLLLVVVLVGLFLNVRLAFWVSIGIPFAFAGMLIVAAVYGITINSISTFGMVLVIGILVDDAIVVSENIYSHYERGMPALQAAVVGTREMLAPVFTSVVTTIIAFTPFFYIEGALGRFIWQMALVVVATLIFSLVEAFLVLPSHVAHSRGLHSKQEDSSLRKWLDHAFTFVANKVYSPSLKFALRHKWATLVSPVSLFMLTIGLLASGVVGFTFYPFIDSDLLAVNVSLVSGRQEADTDSLLARIEFDAWQLNKELTAERADGKSVITGIKRDIGQNDFGETGGHAGRLTLLLLEGEERALDTNVIGSRLRELVGPVPEAENISFTNLTFFGKPVSISLLGSDLAQLDRARDLLLTELKNMGKLKDVTANQGGRREIKIMLKPQAYALGLNLQDIANQVRQGFFGAEAQRIQRGRDELRVWVRYREEDRSDLGFLDAMRIRTANGAEYPFSELADYRITQGLNKINRLDRKREIKIEAEQANVADDLPPILAEIRNTIVPGVLSRVEGVEVSYGGQSRDQARTSRSMARGFGLAFVAMFILVVLVFRSYLQAFLVFSLIPFGVMGAIWGHGIEGMQVNFLSIYGVLALAGILINDSIVLIDQINRNLRKKQNLYHAIYNACLTRLRPILLTSLTTAAGLAPIILETSRQAQFLVPMAVSVAYGLIFGTFLLLIVLPSGYLVLNRVRMIAANFTRPEISPELVEPAVKELLLPNNGLTAPKLESEVM